MAPDLKHHIKTCVLTWAGLSAFLAATYGAAMLPLSPTLSVVSNLGFAALKTGLIAWIFMHLNESQPLTRISGLAALLFLALMFYLTMVDVLFRGN
ncbi:hypothetical protein C882_3540 [Caenispirillum salinarum AK4]|uniref:Caa(3)-type oxidase, subunit IV n=1 Tax=Caenispirillum salinarum AK4 TaxID=1238182 RepID=K9H403_9PROT|nr:cytochrome C oxidase subunit IV family protein [Caenispirillum salinarum]EKV31789.1 hypothetical protein C882_3540 [Caenispirillum salinarum AK4]